MLGIGSTKVSPIDGMDMIYVPAGDFLMGSQEGVGNDDEHPQHAVYLDAYWIDKTEVTNAMYKKCVDSEKCSVPNIPRSNPTGPDGNYSNTYYENFPVINVDWYQAQAYCEWVGKNLPTEAQWEKAARGMDGGVYPWGDDLPNSDLVKMGRYASTWVLTKVGSYPKGASPYGLLDMTGNAVEWIADWYSADYYSIGSNENPKGPTSGKYKVQRGGTWLANGYVYVYRVADRSVSDPRGVADAGFGFRCALSATQTEEPIFTKTITPVPSATSIGSTNTPVSYSIPAKTIGNVKCRKGPSDLLYGYDQVLDPQDVEIMGKNAEGSWLYFKTMEKGSTCWTTRTL